MTSLRNICPVCRVYDPSWLAHHRDCPLSRGDGAVVLPALVAAHWRRHPPAIALTPLPRKAG